MMVAVLHNIRSMHNVGSLFRTADAAGIEKLCLCGITPTPVDEYGRIRPQLAKVSLGAEQHVAWERARSTARVLDGLKKDGYRIFALEQSKKSIPYTRIKLSRKQLAKTAFVVGNEVKGLTPTVLSRADKILEIPMRGTKESLNVAVAFGIVVFHFAMHLSQKRLP
ncbi:MAG: TrmH family RNA methyltransferase [Patescibacteria group bacterium]